MIQNIFFHDKVESLANPSTNLSTQTIRRYQQRRRNVSRITTCRLLMIMLKWSSENCNTLYPNFFKNNSKENYICGLDVIIDERNVVNDSYNADPILRSVKSIEIQTFTWEALLCFLLKHKNICRQLKHLKKYRIVVVLNGRSSNYKPYVPYRTILLMERR